MFVRSVTFRVGQSSRQLYSRFIQSVVVLIIPLGVLVLWKLRQPECHAIISFVSMSTVHTEVSICRSYWHAVMNVMKQFLELYFILPILMNNVSWMVINTWQVNVLLLRYMEYKNWVASGVLWRRRETGRRKRRRESAAFSPERHHYHTGGSSWPFSLSSFLSPLYLLPSILIRKNSWRFWCGRIATGLVMSD